MTFPFLKLSPNAGANGIIVLLAKPKIIIVYFKMNYTSFYTSSVADPGFLVGGRGPRRGAWTPEAATFRKICMSK